MAAAAAVLVALGVGLGTALWQADRARQQAEEARNQAERATALNTFVLSLIQQFDPRASQASKAADLALLSSIERRIDAEFKGSADQLLQLRVTVGNAYRERGQLSDARRVYRRAIGEAEAALPANHLGLLKARVARAWFAVADDEALQSLDTTIELLRQSGAAGTEPLIDALLARVDSAKTIGRRPGMTWDSLYADSREAYDLASRHFGAGSAHQLRAAQDLTFTLTRQGGASVRRRIERRSLHGRRERLGRGTHQPAIAEGNVDLLNAELEYGVLLCGFRNLDDGTSVRSGMSRRLHASTTATIRYQKELAFYHLAEPIGRPGDPGSCLDDGRAYRMHASRDEHRRGRSRIWLQKVARIGSAMPGESPNVPTSRIRPWFTSRRCLRGNSGR